MPKGEITWVALNDQLRTANETECQSLLQAELAGANRVRWLLRIHSRLNRLRADEERTTLKALAHATS